MSAQIELELQIGEIEVTGRLVDASNATLFGKVDSREVVYKPIAGERPLWDFPDGNLASREVAAYQISKDRFDVVPPTILRDGPFGTGAVQLWIDCPSDFDPISLATSDDPRVRELALFDIVINNTDRKFGHILLDESGKLYGCDHGVSLHQDWKLRTVIWQFAGLPLNLEENEKLLGLLKDLESGELELDDLLTVSEIAAIKERVREILEVGKFPEPDQEWPAIPWPPV
jgi:hypothetical protein